ncbi:hypothetical protein PsorP6_002288 [Peronosclerospora sorghi]|uniref:Uncharacterized protein n=1 Tax=Peronosclerospora sorghi TaxID=230839 RepID=A0ACC0WUL2_9STRA|nr:hypothetical protein PsorP6_002288 [Peronosclerospora sorghi]
MPGKNVRRFVPESWIVDSQHQIVYANLKFASKGVNSKYKALHVNMDAYVRNRVALTEVNFVSEVGVVEDVMYTDRHGVDPNDDDIGEWMLFYSKDPDPEVDSIL